MLGTLKGEGFELPLTATDRVYLARMMAQEEGEGASYQAAHAIGSVILRRYAVGTSARLERGLSPLWPDLTALLHDYGNWPPGPDRERARRLYTASWAELRAPIRRAADDLVHGRSRLSGAPAIHWGSCGAQLLTGPGCTPEPPNEIVTSAAANTLVSTVASRAYPEPRVVGASDANLGPLAGLVGFGLGIGALFAVTRLVRRKQR